MERFFPSQIQIFSGHHRLIMHLSGMLCLQHSTCLSHSVWCNLSSIRTYALEMFVLWPSNAGFRSAAKFLNNQAFLYLFSNALSHDSLLSYLLLDRSMDMNKTFNSSMQISTSWGHHDFIASIVCFPKFSI